MSLGSASATVLAERPAAENSENEHEQRDADGELSHG
jgi:hypothetical protein